MDCGCDLWASIPVWARQNVVIVRWEHSASFETDIIIYSDVMKLWEMRKEAVRADFPTYNTNEMSAVGAVHTRCHCRHTYRCRSTSRLLFANYDGDAPSKCVWWTEIMASSSRTQTRYGITRAVMWAQHTLHSWCTLHAQCTEADAAQPRWCDRQPDVVLLHENNFIPESGVCFSLIRSFAASHIIAILIWVRWKCYLPNE